MGASVRQRVSRQKPITRNLRLTAPYLPDPWRCRNTLTRTARRDSTAPVDQRALSWRAMWPFQRNRSHRVRSSGPYWLLRNGMGDAAPALAPVDRMRHRRHRLRHHRRAHHRRTHRHRAGHRDAGCARSGAGQHGGEHGPAAVRNRHAPDGSRARRSARSAPRARTAPARPVSKCWSGAFPSCCKPADYRRRESLYLAADQSAVPALRAELAARRLIGFACEWLEGDELATPLRLPPARRHPLGAGRRDRSGALHAGA